MRCFFIPAVYLLSCANALVSFKYSTVIQAPDIAGTNRVNFKCANTCKVYADFKSDKLMITTQNGGIVATFNDIFGANAVAPAGFMLQPNVDYYVENRGEVNPQFVVYVVDSKAPNYGASVYVPQDTFGVAVKDSARYVTILSSLESIWFSSFAGSFPSGYPRIYAAPYDAVGDDCRPVFQARSQYNAEMSWPTIATAVFTVDFGFAGAHNVSANSGKIKDLTKNAGMSTVYTSPGYVGCTSNAGQNYYSKLTQVQDKFSLTAESLDIDAAWTGLAAAEPVTFTVNGKLTNFVGTTAKYSDHFGKGSMDVDLSWTRSTSGSSFVIQLDFSNSGCSMSMLAFLLVVAACLF